MKNKYRNFFTDIILSKIIEKLSNIIYFILILSISFFTLRNTFLLVWLISFLLIIGTIHLVIAIIDFGLSRKEYGENRLQEYLDDIIVNLPSTITYYFSLFIISIIILFIWICFNFYTSTNYKTKEFIIQNGSDFTVSNQPNNPSFNNYFMNYFWSQNELSYSKNTFDYDQFSYRNEKDENYTIKTPYFGLLFISERMLPLLNINDVMIDKSLLDSFIVKNKNGDKIKYCFIGSKNNILNQYFYNNQFILTVSKDKMIFNSLYAPPLNNNDLLNQLVLIAKTCH